jgi:cytochrome c oxidase assembly factor CtaG
MGNTMHRLAQRLNTRLEQSRRMTVTELPLAVEYVWSLNVPALLAVTCAGGVYAWRLRDLRRDPAARTRDTPTHDTLRALAFAGGLVIVVIALMSPIEQLGEERLFTMHMVQHLLLADLAPILLLAGLSRAFMRPAVRRLRPLEERLGPLAHPAAALLLYVGLMGLWHIPAMYELALDHAWAHALEHASFFTAGIAFWWFLIEPVPPRHRLTGPWPLWYLATAKVLMGLLGVILAFSPDALYSTYEDAPRTWGLSPVEDQNVGGLVMMLEQSLVLVIAFAVFFTRMLDRSEAEQRRREAMEG